MNCQVVNVRSSCHMVVRSLIFHICLPSQYVLPISQSRILRLFEFGWYFVQISWKREFFWFFCSWRIIDTFSYGWSTRWCFNIQYCWHGVCYVPRAITFWACVFIRNYNVILCWWRLARLLCRVIIPGLCPRAFSFINNILLTSPTSHFNLNFILWFLYQDLQSYSGSAIISLSIFATEAFLVE